MAAAAALSPLENPVASTTIADAPPVTGIDRHCAFCLDLVPAEKVLLCGKCQRRAYCSKPCRERDWNNNSVNRKGAAPQQGQGGQRGQGHKNWCALAAGEEDLDWKVTEIEGKGLGLVALRDFPAGSRIIVEAGQPTPFSHPKTSELMPLTNKDAEGNLRVATKSELKAKFDLNGLGCEDEKEVLCLRISRVNHSCFPNADHYYDKERKVKILYAVKAVPAGAEICISYVNFTAFNSGSKTGSSAEERHGMLQLKWGFDCSSDSPCRDKQLQRRIAVATRIYDQIPLQGRSRDTTEQALGGVRALLQVCDSLGLPQLVKVVVLYDGFQIAVSQRATLDAARAYINQLCGLVETIYHPEDASLRKYLNWKEDVRRHYAYLLMDKGRMGGGGGCPMA